MATRNPVAITVDGVAATYHPAAAGDKATGAGSDTWITVRNAGAAPVTLTINPAGKTSYGVALPAKTFEVAAAGELDIPLLAAYADPNDSHLVALAWSAVADVTWAVKRI